MARNYPFNREEPLPSFWANVIQDILSGAAFDLQLTAKDSNTVQVVPREPTGLSSVIIQGRWRFNSSAVERDVPGNGTWTVWAVSLDNDIDDSPDPFTDHTNYAWDLRMTDGANPSGTGVEIFEKIGTVVVASGIITKLRQTAFSVGSTEIQDSAVENDHIKDGTIKVAKTGMKAVTLNVGTVANAAVKAVTYQHELGHTNYIALVTAQMGDAAWVFMQANNVVTMETSMSKGGGQTPDYVSGHPPDDADGKYSLTVQVRNSTGSSQTGVKVHVLLIPTV